MQSFIAEWCLKRVSCLTVEQSNSRASCYLTPEGKTPKGWFRFDAVFVHIYGVGIPSVHASICVSGQTWTFPDSVPIPGAHKELMQFHTTTI